MEWYYEVLILLGILGIFVNRVFARIGTLEEKLFNHLSEYGKFVGTVDTTIKFFRDHFEELDEAINHKTREK